MIVQIYDKDERQGEVFFIIRVKYMTPVRRALEKVWKKEDYDTEDLEKELKKIKGLKFIFNIVKEQNKKQRIDLREVGF